MINHKAFNHKSVKRSSDDLSCVVLVPQYALLRLKRTFDDLEIVLLVPQVALLWLTLDHVTVVPTQRLT